MCPRRWKLFVPRRAESHSCVFIDLCDIHDVAQEIGKSYKKLLTPWLIF